MQRRRLATIASLFFSVFWAAVSWPWFIYGGHPVKKHAVPLLLCVFFIVLTTGLAASKRWARRLGFAAAVALLVLLLIGIAGTYFFSLFGDQAFDFRMASGFLAGIALSVALIRLLARPLVLASQPAELEYPVWIPLTFSAAYLVGSWMFGLYAGSGTWGGLARAISIDIAMFWIAIPSIVLLWLTWAWWTRGKIIRPLGILLAAGFIIPLAAAIVTFEIFTANAAVDKRLAERTEYQLANAHMSELTDEVLLSTRGNPIGIRIRYTVRFDEGLDDLHYRPNVQLGFDSMPAMWNSRSETVPLMTDSFPKGEFRVTEDFVPYYFPGFMRFPDTPQRADDRCIYWGSPKDREFAKNTKLSTQRLAFFSQAV